MKYYVSVVPDDMSIAVRTCEDVLLSPSKRKKLVAMLSGIGVNSKISDEQCFCSTCVDNNLALVPVDITSVIEDIIEKIEQAYVWGIEWVYIIFK
jgi:hypothetical protein